uniref:Crystaline entomocidal protoxin n=1 Tax=Bacillus thuringiensis TaxID=1428 RepID=U5KRW1_BACTU|nr:pesticidal protein [Bacillus thuringiensis]
MDCNLQSQQNIPYNVLAIPVSNVNSLTDTVGDLKKAWEEFQKTGSFSLTALQQGFSASQGGTFNYLTLLQSGISLAGSFVPGGTFVAPIINMVIGWLWPHKNKNADTENLINLIDSEIQKQLNKALLDADRNEWSSYLESIFDSSNNLNGAIVDAQWSGTVNTTNRTLRNPTESDYTNVVTNFIAADGDIANNENHIMNGNFDVAAAPYFVIGATARFAAMQSYIKFCNAWIDKVGLSDAQLTTQKANLDRTKQNMRNAILNYTQQVMKVFKDSKNMPTIGTNKFSVDTYNVYIKGMTLNVLDIVAIWPSLYPDDYTSQTALEQTRVTFSNMVGQEEGTDGSLRIYNTFDSFSYQHSPIPNNNVNLISYYNDELQNLELGVYTPPKKGSGYSYPYGFVLNYANSKYKYGDSNDPESLGGLSTLSAPIQQVNAATQNSKYLDGEILNGIGASLPGYCTTGCSPTEPPFSCTSTANGYKASCNPSDTNQKINALYPFTQANVKGNTGKLGVLASLVSYDLNPKNVFGELDSDTNNVILKGIPAEKGYFPNNARPTVVKEWINGASAVPLDSGNTLFMTATNLTATQYRIRIRYANPNSNTQIGVRITQNGSLISSSNLTLYSTTDMNNTLPLNVYVIGENGNYTLQDLYNTTNVLSTGDITLQITGGDQKIFIDRIEFVPTMPVPGNTNNNNGNNNGNNNPPHHVCAIAGTQQSCSGPPKFEQVSDLEKITTQVYMLFKSSPYEELALEVSSYQISQVALKVMALSDELFCEEKNVLRKLVNKAKQLLEASNLLVGGNFETTQNWVLGTNAYINYDSFLFNGNYLSLQPASGFFTSYAYQKIDESTLKPYTRYKVSGFIGQSNQVELIISRYGKEIDKILNVPYAGPLPITADASITCCAPEIGQCDGEQSDSHFFNYSIDVGALHPELNPGIEIGLKIVQSNGYITISNLEIIEERPLTEMEIQAVNRKNQKWEREKLLECASISELLQPIINQIDSLFKDGNWYNDILPHVTYQDLKNIIIPELPKLKHWFIENLPGEYHEIEQKMKEALKYAFTQLDEKNLIHNGHFTTNLIDWQVEGDAQMKVLENDALALQLFNWDASASQSINILEFDEDKAYKLRVYAQGSGTIQFGNCEDEAIQFNTNSFIYQEKIVYFDTPSVNLHIQSEGSEFIVSSIDLIELSDDQ